MDVYICFESALELLRLRFDAPFHQLPRTAVWQPGPCVLASQLPAGVGGLRPPVHVLLDRQTGRREPAQVRQHVCSLDLPAGSFVELGGGLWVCSPELVFLQMASSLSLIELILLGFELCGTYSLLPHEEEQGHASPRMDDLDVSDPRRRGFNNRPPLTSVERIKAFLARTPGMKGGVKAARALRYVIDGSASPMESKLAMLLTLPYGLGGFGFPQPALNHRIVPTRYDRRGAGQRHYVCDLYWPERGVAVEYDSDLAHATSERLAADAVRRNALALLGVTSYTVGRKQINDAREMNRIAFILARALGRRLRPPKKSFSARQYVLRRTLLWRS